MKQLKFTELKMAHSDQKCPKIANNFQNYLKISQKCFKCLIISQHGPKGQKNNPKNLKMATNGPNCPKCPKTSQEDQKRPQLISNGQKTSLVVPKRPKLDQTASDGHITVNKMSKNSLTQNDLNMGNMTNNFLNDPKSKLPKIS